MAERARADGGDAADSQATMEAVNTHARAAADAGVEPGSVEALAVVERIEAMTPGDAENRVRLADRIGAFTDRRVARYWALVGIVKGWPQSSRSDSSVEAWEWYARALRAHAVR